MINQLLLPFQFEVFTTLSCEETCHAIKNMIVRGAGSIGATAAFAMTQAFLEAPLSGTLEYIDEEKSRIEATRPTAKDLFRAVDEVYSSAIKCLISGDIYLARKQAKLTSGSIFNRYIEASRLIGVNGSPLISGCKNVLTHCNAGFLGLVDYGSALSPIYHSVTQGNDIHVWVDETRPRGQGARLTAWELQQAGIKHTVIADNAAAHLMSLGKVDAVITGADRIASNGDTANKVGTLEKAILAREFDIPFYVAAPMSTFDLSCGSGSDIDIEYRSEDEVLYQSGVTGDGNMEEILVCNPGSSALNPAFDVTPAKYIKAYITENGVFKPQEIKLQG